MSNVSVEKLKELGFEKAANDIEDLARFKAKCAIAYELYKVVSPEQIRTFNRKLYKKTLKSEQYRETYDKLVFHKIKDYPEVPPPVVLNALAKAKEKNCFDTFEIAKIESVEKRIDPILFGCIEGCKDKFAVAQWDNDITVEEIIDESV